MHMQYEIVRLKFTKGLPVERNFDMRSDLKGDKITMPEEECLVEHSKHCYKDVILNTDT